MTSRIRRTHGLSAQVAQVLGAPVGLALPVGRRDPRLVLALSVTEMAAFVATIVTGSVPLLALTTVVGAALVGMRAFDQRRILAVASSGVTVVAASVAGRPLAALGPAPPDLRLGSPSGLGSPVVFGDRTWWVDRSDFARLQRARELLPDQAPSAPPGSTAAGS